MTDLTEQTVEDALVEVSKLTADRTKVMTDTKARRKPVGVFTVSEFKGKESIRDWDHEIERIAIEIQSITDKQGRLLGISAQPLVQAYLAVDRQIQDLMQKGVL